MGDRCHLRITLRREDLKRFAPFLDKEPDQEWGDYSQAGEADIVTVEVFEANYALYDERHAAAQAGIPFLGQHGEGGEYGPYAFASLDGEMLEAPLSRDGELILAVDRELQPVGEVDGIRNYVAKLRAVEALFGLKEAA